MAKFVKGQSGNPGGLKRNPPEFKKMFEAATPDAIRLLVETVNDDAVGVSTRVKCAEIILDRSLGKPQQAVSIDAESIPQVVFVGCEQIKD